MQGEDVVQREKADLPWTIGVEMNGRASRGRCPESVHDICSTFGGEQRRKEDQGHRALDDVVEDSAWPSLARSPDSRFERHRRITVDESLDECIRNAMFKTAATYDP